jgi:CubicO group peptidase (beta-lactamase class C family)
VTRFLFGVARSAFTAITRDVTRPARRTGSVELVTLNLDPASSFSNVDRSPTVEAEMNQSARVTRLPLNVVMTALAMLAPSLAPAQSPRNPAVDRVFAEWDKPTSPGCALGVIRDGRIVYERGYGMANLDYDIPNGPGMVYYIGSDSKQFTAAAVGMLALRGQISLDDDVRKYFPELPDYGAPVRIRHLIHHTSGLRDIYTLMSLRGDRLEDVFPDSQALALIVRQRGLAFPPGSAYSYSNTGYFLLAQLVKRVSGRTLREFTDAEIFQPLGMTHTHFHDDPGHVMKNRAMSYEPDGKGGFRISYLQNFDKVGAGGLYSTVRDLQRWDENFYTHKVGGPALQALIHTRGVLTSGDTLPYAFGNNVTTYRGLRTVEHGGSMMGYKAYIARFPDQRLSVLATCNLGSIDPGPLAHAVAEVYLGTTMSAPPKAAARAASASPVLFTGPVEHPDRYVGEYYSDDLDATFRIVRREDGGLGLLMPRQGPLRLDAEGGDSFRAGQLRLHFPGTGATAGSMEVRVARMGMITMKRREP